MHGEPLCSAACCSEEAEGIKSSTWWCNAFSTDGYTSVVAPHGAGLALIDLNFGRQSIEWGYGIDPDLWGQGYILQIQEALKEYVFNILELNRIHGVTMSNNLRTIESITAAGMTHEGIVVE